MLGYLPHRLNRTQVDACSYCINFAVIHEVNLPYLRPVLRGIGWAYHISTHSLGTMNGLAQLGKIQGPYACAGADVKGTLRLDDGSFVQCSPENQLE